MFRILVRLTVAVVVIGAAAVATARLNNPPSARTNAPPIGAYIAELNCTVAPCHTGSPLNEAGGLLEILDIPASFELNTTYPIRVRLARTWAPMPPDPLHWGFELTVLRADSGTSYGTFAFNSPDLSTITPATGSYVGRTYIRHDQQNHEGDVGPVEWTFDWTTPGYPANKVYFFAAGNAANGDVSPSGDKIYTASDSVYWDDVLGVPDPTVAQTELSSPAPNPSRGAVSFNYRLAHAGSMDLSVFDVNGRHVRTLLSGYRAAGPSYVTWDARSEWGSRVASGVYFAKLAAPGGASLVRKLILTD
jgi:hypothetical protein